MVKNPVFVTPHAVKQFQRRVAPWPAGAVIDFLLARLQRLPDEVDVAMASLLYRVPFAGRHITVVVGRGEGEWPAVITVIGCSAGEAGNGRAGMPGGCAHCINGDLPRKNAPK
jgi:hypothetical protein